MVIAVSFEDLPGIFCRQTGKSCCCHHKKSGHSRRNIIEYVVHFCCKTSEIQIFFILISDHGIHRVDCLIEGSKHRSADRQIQKRCHHTIRGIFCHRLHGCFCHTFCCQPLRISADDHGNRIACRLQILFFQFFVNLHALIFQRFCRQHPVAEQCHHGQMQIRMDPARQIQHTCHRPGSYTADDHCQKYTCCLFALFCLWKNCPKPFFRNCDQITDQSDRMIEAVRIADQQIEKHTEQKCHHAFSSIYHDAFSLSSFFVIQFSRNRSANIGLE